jgi:exopolyphosphatase/guanosine-5'-triphosphate,3'-diphosphate pyrophosphatase
LVFDLGGGSTEIILGHAGERSVQMTRAASLDIGSVRLTERHVRSDPARAEEIADVRRAARTALDQLDADGLPAGHVVGVAGTVTTLAAFALGVAPYDAARVHGARLSASTVANATLDLGRLTLAERRAIPAIDPGRADVIVAGAAIVEEILAWSEAGELVVSDRGVRWGLAGRLAVV